ncbi:MAG TPA: arginine--tRNA ligase, partial [Candidatus Dormibacteraeota bacterium]|nr:arginine--tRNA ligase [Candidatus Dormibacteraeota bacterium]
MPIVKSWPIEGYLIDRLQAAIGKTGLALPEGVPVEVEVPREAEHGDWASNVALALAKSARRPPRDVAKSLIEALEVDPTVVAAVETAGAGFLNFRLAPEWLQGTVRKILAEVDTYGASEAGGGEKVLVEYVSANPTGPLNVVSARAASIGDTLIRILNAAGWRAAGEFYCNDWGLQAELFGASI